jgi:cell wall-associated NlpC family hydrolase
MNPTVRLAAALLALSLSGAAVAQESRPEPAGTDVAQFAQNLAERANTLADRASSLADRATSTAQELVLYSMGLIGIRYVFGGRSPETGFDCSGLVRYVFDRVTGRSLPHTSYEMAGLGMQVSSTDLQPGDLVFYNTRGRRNSHVGIYIGDGRFIHAPSRGGRVHIANMTERYWVTRFNGARRLTTT